MNDYLKAIRITESVYWVGAVDWAVRNFHGYETSSGTTYNAYLILADKVTLVDTVKAPFKDEMMARIASVIKPEDIQVIVSNHSEMDHSGCLPAVCDLVKPEKVYASVMGEKALNSHFELDVKIDAVKTGDEIDLGGKTLSFMETKMLHWPDSMFSYLKEEKLLFSQDAFGMHLATSKLFVDENDSAKVEWECEKYFANILMPFSAKILALLEKVGEMDLAIDVVATDHGPIWRGDDIGKVMKWYETWSNKTPANKAIVVYATMWGSTAQMATTICDGLRSVGTVCKLLPLDACHRSDLATEALEAGALIVGSPTINNEIFPSVADVLTYLRGLKPKNMIGAAFGSYGWSGESVKHLNELLDGMKIERVSDGVKVKYVPDAETLKACFDLGVAVGKRLSEGRE